MMHGAETWAVKRAQVKKLEVAEMRMLRFMCGVTKKDRVRNERIRGATKVCEISKKLQESRLRWFGHVKRRGEEYVGKIVMKMEAEGMRKRGRPRRRWVDCIKEELKAKRLTEEEAVNRAHCRRLIGNIDPTQKWEKMQGKKKVLSFQ